MGDTILIYSIWKSPVGLIAAAAGGCGLCRISLNIDESGFIAKLEKEYQCKPVRSSSSFNLLERKFDAYFEGRNKDIKCKLDLKKTTCFQRQVWRVLTQIPYGQTRSYKWVADKMGKPTASQAVGQANAANPFPIVIPCHRVISSNGALGGYSAGAGIKQQLLSLEASL